MFNCPKKEDPYLGNGTFGQLARFGPEQCAVMHLQLLELDDKWDTKNDFEWYNLAYNTAGPAVQDFLDNSTTVFFQRFSYIFDKHMVKNGQQQQLFITYSVEIHITQRSLPAGLCITRKLRT